MVNCITTREIYKILCDHILVLIENITFELTLINHLHTTTCIDNVIAYDLLGTISMKETFLRNMRDILKRLLQNFLFF